MNTNVSPVPGIFHFLQHGSVSPQDWQALCQAITTAYLTLYWQPGTLDLDTAPVICEHTGNCLYQFDDNLVRLGMTGFNGKRFTHLAGDPFILYRRQTPHALIRCDTRGYPYHWLVMATLLLTNTLCPTTWTIESDVPVKHWRKVAHWLTYYYQIPVSLLS
ncbi:MULTISPECIES: hypothetical protein [unclassified Serratia (in: enterobacteria)]|uniref:hypothetical protein n=1 Tax=unclassified Serratia (in: enterobacteria) TaxID=2647522 RepID=UPI0005089DE3|nr:MULTISPECIES: hypothetical protein [unclassified Serratia (in: enterobacteria)]KFK97754.1 hypothetical protein JV45_00220 [Serratia sp. Ag2]KFL00145.1 hypothetical protein IV04_01530 [Serratia sp. Ag1]